MNIRVLFQFSGSALLCCFVLTARKIHSKGHPSNSQDLSALSLGYKWHESPKTSTGVSDREEPGTSSEKNYALANRIIYLKVNTYLLFIPAKPRFPWNQGNTISRNLSGLPKFAANSSQTLQSRGAVVSLIELHNEWRIAHPKRLGWWNAGGLARAWNCGLGVWNINDSHIWHDETLVILGVRWIILLLHLIHPKKMINYSHLLLIWK